MASPWWHTSKDIGGIVCKGHIPPPRLVTAFVAPATPTAASPGLMRVHPAALHASMARCGALARVSPAFNAALIASASALTSEAVDDPGPSFDVVHDVADLADFERTSLSARIGNGITDLYMSQLGYVWRDLASSFIATSARLADFAYDGGPATGHGIVLAEAKAAVSNRATAAAVATIADRGYTGQVEPHLASSTRAGQVVHGYAIAFGAQPTVAGATIRLAETSPSTRGGGASAASGGAISTVRVSIPMAAGNYRAVFMLADAPGVYGALDALTGAPATAYPPAPQSFATVVSAGRRFLIGAGPLFRHARRLPWWPTFGYGPLLPRPPLFAIAEEVAEPLLNQLPALLAGDPSRPRFFDLPVLPRVLTAEVPTPPHILFADGYALLLDWSDIRAFRGWSPGQGLTAPGSTPPDPLVFI